MPRKILRENNENEYAKAIREVEELMLKNEVSLSYLGCTPIIVRIKDREYCMNSTVFPRMFDDDVLEIREG